MGKNKLPKFGLRLDPEQLERVKEYADSKRLTATDVIRIAIDFYLNHEEKL